MTEEERMELEFDKKHLSMELVAAGDDVNRPLTGDVVRVRYTAYTLTTAGLYNAENLKVCFPFSSPLILLPPPLLSRWSPVQSPGSRGRGWSSCWGSG
jgi:hypothetical protein